MDACFMYIRAVSNEKKQPIRKLKIRLGKLTSSKYLASRALHAFVCSELTCTEPSSLMQCK